MSSKALSLEIKVNLPIVIGLMTAFHVLMMIFNVPVLPGPFSAQNSDRRNSKAIFNIKNIRRMGAKQGSKLNDTLLVKNDNRTKAIVDPGTLSSMPSTAAASAPQSRPLSMKDLSLPTPQIPKSVAMKAQPEVMKRPGTRPDVGPAAPKKAIEAISLKGNAEMRRFLKGSVAGSDAIALSGDERQSGFSNSDVSINLEVPEGVNPDELNEYEMMFYGFQRRTAMNYVNSFYDHLDEFQKKNPHKKFPMTDTKQTMTGRLTYDEKGNIKQIKMVRWSNVDGLQDFFTEVLKDMDTLHNPPTALWEKSGEFSVFFTLVING